MNKRCRESVVIAGAGLGGLTAALSLHAAGIDAIVVESAREIRRSGAGINLLPQAVRELTELGLGDQLAGLGVATAENVYVDRHGARIFAEPRGLARGYRWPQYSIHRGELQMLLLTAVRERLGHSTVRTGTQLQHFTQTEHGVRIELHDRAHGTLEHLDTAVLIGADGLHSTVRALLHPDEGPPRFSGIWTWRGVTPTKPFLSGRTMILATDEHQTRLIAYPISEITSHSGQVMINWVCEVPLHGRQPPRRADWNRAVQAADVLPYYADWSFDWLDVNELLCGSARILEYPMVDRDPLPNWGDGRVNLLGDAAHPMYPVGANGAGQAILDARTLAYALATTADSISGLQHYEAMRRPATKAAVLASRDMNRAERGAAHRNAAELTRTGELTGITDAYQRNIGGDVDAVNTRSSLTPPSSGHHTALPGSCPTTCVAESAI